MIQNKRDSLEKFIHDQMVGPGGCNNRYDYICEEGDCVSDVINTTPGSLYSTAILFPKKSVSVEPMIDDVYEEAVDDIQSEESGIDVDTNERVGALSQSEEDDLYSLSQRFPNSIGISCCLDTEGSVITPDDLKVTISGRYYTKIKDEYFNCIVIKPEITYSDIELFYNKNKELQAYFSLDNRGVRINNILKKQEEYLNAKKVLLGIDLQECKKIAKISSESFDSIYETTKPEYRYLKSYKEKLWSKLRQIKDGEYLSDVEKNGILARIQCVEKYQTIISHFDDALNICNSKSFGYWTGRNFCHVVDLSMLSFDTHNRKTIYSPKANPSLKDLVAYVVEDDDGEINASLSVWIQLTISPSEPNKRYFKIQLENTSDPFEEDSKHYFSIVTEKVNERSFFGVEIKVESEKLCPYKELGQSGNIDSDIARLNYLYRSIRDYGIGHMCSVTWGEDINGKWVKSEFIPSYETPDVEPIPRDKHSEYITVGDKYVPKEFLNNSKALEFKWLSTFSNVKNDEIVSQLYEFIDTYHKWIEQLKTQSDRSQFAELNISLCEQDYQRMRSNIALLLEGNDQNVESFRLMNSAMFIQLWHSKNSTLEEADYKFYVKTSDHLFGDNPATWRPFQLAFILLNLDGVIQRPDDPLWHARNELVDLVWFPTGGGKTEAYLGIIALTIINRRITEDSGRHGGTTAIMRYTLRLLATQQFQRAMRVILSLEQLRKWDNEKLGDEPISIGLYVGSDSLPNTAQDLLAECKLWSNININKRAESKIPLDHCPWCGKELEFRNTKSDSNPDIKFLCSNINCSFSDSLPVKLCDEDIYTTPPTLLFGTVDKFAMIGHNVSTDEKKRNKDSRRIFGGGDLSNLPPVLIIQDELHLLLGPLGSAVSLFEAAIDQLCSTVKVLDNGEELVVRPKIISSTATTRNTELQVRALYDRQVNIFPKSGLDYDDSFFAFYKRERVDGKIRYVSKRKYIGILPMGRTQMTTQMRLIATIFVHRALFENEYNDRLDDSKVAEAIDFYHSTISYFNSLKEVGKTDAQFYTEFTKYTRRLFKRVARQKNMLECYYAYDSAFSKSELTGRLSGAEVVDQLAKVSKKWDPSIRLPHMSTSGNQWHRGVVPPDLILATNMISVGLDVDRFNTIVMNSMPRNIAEYIQASSRVARNKPGLVIALHNPFRARDLSHFERFIEFHEKLYYYVEPISITPFSKQAVTKYLPLYLATMIRHKYENLANVDDASKLTQAQVTKISADLCEYFKLRLNRTKQLSDDINGIMTDDLERNIEQVIDQALHQWQQLVIDNKSKGNFLLYSGAEYRNRKSTKTKYANLFLPLDAFEEDKSNNFWSVPMSLRNVEPEAVININEQDI